MSPDPLRHPPYDPLEVVAWGGPTPPEQGSGFARLRKLVCQPSPRAETGCKDVGEAAVIAWYVDAERQQIASIYA